MPCSWEEEENSTDGSIVNALDLHLNLAGHDKIDLTFQHVGVLNQLEFEDAIFLSDDGGKTFKRAFDLEIMDFFEVLPLFGLSLWGSLPPIELDRIVNDLQMSLTDSFVVRFQNRGTNRDHFTVLDDIMVKERHLKYLKTYPFFDGFETGKLDSSWRWGNPNLPSLTAPSGSVNIGGLVDVKETFLNGVAQPFEGANFAFLGNVSQFLPNQVNALDLYLDLSDPGITEVLLSFHIADLDDETQLHDAIFFSNDGGESFVNILPLDPASWPNVTYQLISLDVKSLAQAKGIDLTNTCIVRFQEFGDGGAVAISNIDGILLDNVSVELNTDPTSVVETKTKPTAFGLHQNYPNPFNPTTTITYQLPQAEEVELIIYDQLGREVRRLVSERQSQGSYQMQWHGRNEQGQQVASGVYLYRLKAGGFVETKKLLLLK